MISVIRSSVGSCQQCKWPAGDVTRDSAAECCGRSAMTAIASSSFAVGVASIRHMAAASRSAPHRQILTDFLLSFSPTMEEHAEYGRADHYICRVPIAVVVVSR